ncbi:protein kinase C-binding protein 1-like isoform X2 [Contarinia nasturtii]|nr:protein kinase C-binding protein 1-like isoform X2 [Contarinia nasturtii]
MANVLKKPKFRVFKNMDSSYNATAVNPIDLDTIADNIDGQRYASFFAFLIDIECILHNCCICYGGRHERTKAARSLFEFCTLETQAISSCSDCYKSKHMYPNDWRTRACAVPHLLLWVKLNRSLDFWPVRKGFVYWPAKLVSIGSNESTIILFGHPEFVNVDSRSISKSTIYSTETPNMRSDESDPHWRRSICTENPSKKNLVVHVLIQNQYHSNQHTYLVI